MSTTLIPTARRPRNGRYTLHRDHTVTTWDVYCRQWRRMAAADALETLGASLWPEERQLFARVAARVARAAEGA